MKSTYSSMRFSQVSNASFHSSIAPITGTRYSPSNQAVSAEVARASTKTSPAKKSQNLRKTCSNIAHSAPTLSIPSTSTAINSATVIVSN